MPVVVQFWPASAWPSGHRPRSFIRSQRVRMYSTGVTPPPPVGSGSSPSFSLVSAHNQVHLASTFWSLQLLFANTYLESSRLGTILVAFFETPSPATVPVFTILACDRSLPGTDDPARPFTIPHANFFVLLPLTRCAAYHTRDSLVYRRFHPQIRPLPPVWGAANASISIYIFASFPLPAGEAANAFHIYLCVRPLPPGGVSS